MSQSVALLVGGTKVLERALQAALPQARHVIAATMEEATGTLATGDVRLLTIGPTMRRGLQAVTALRAGGSTEPRILVVFRDDQQSEVKRHQKGAATADRYVSQSRIGKELTDAAAALWQLETEEPQTSELEELGADAIEEVEALEDEVTLSAEDASEEPPPVEEVLGEFDAGAFEQTLDEAAQAREEAVEVLEDAQFEEELGGEDVQLADEEGAETLEVAEWTEEDELATEPVEVSAEVVEELLDLEPVEDVAVAGDAEQLDMADLQEETAEDNLETLAPEAVQVVTARLPTPSFSPARTQHKTATYQVAPLDVRPSSEGAALEPEPRRSPSSLQVADDLSGIVGRLQEMSGLIARLELENETLRAENDELRATRAPDRTTEVLELEGRWQEADRLLAAQSEELQNMRAELQASRAQAAAAEARAQQRQQAAAGAARSLLEIAAALEG